MKPAGSSEPVRAARPDLAYDRLYSLPPVPGDSIGIQSAGSAGAILEGTSDLFIWCPATGFQMNQRFLNILRVARLLLAGYGFAAASKTHPGFCPGAQLCQILTNGVQ